MVTPNEVEAEEITGVHVEDLESAKKAAEYFYDKGVKQVLITLGSKGVFVSADGREEIIPAYHVEALDTTGAGDAFCGCILHYILEHGWREYNEKELGEMLEFANAAASIVTTRKGALRVMPKLEEISHVQRGV